MQDLQSHTLRFTVPEGYSFDDDKLQQGADVLQSMSHLLSDPENAEEIKTHVQKLLDLGFENLNVAVSEDLDEATMAKVQAAALSLFADLGMQTGAPQMKSAETASDAADSGSGDEEMEDTEKAAPAKAVEADSDSSDSDSSDDEEEAPTKATLAPAKVADDDSDNSDSSDSEEEVKSAPVKTPVKKEDSDSESSDSDSDEEMEDTPKPATTAPVQKKSEESDSDSDSDSSDEEEKAPAKQTEKKEAAKEESDSDSDSDSSSDSDDEKEAEEPVKSVKSVKKKKSEPFRRVKASGKHLKSNAWSADQHGGHGAEAFEKLGKHRGKEFIKAKNKRKRSNRSGYGSIDTAVRSIDLAKRRKLNK